MSEMVERVAKTMLKVLKPSGARDMRSVDLDGTDFDFIEAVRAGIEAMREPTIEMRKVCSFEAAEVDWPAMIDAALKEPAKAAS